MWYQQNNFSKEIIPWCKNYVIMYSNDIPFALEKLLASPLNVVWPGCMDAYWDMWNFFVEWHIYNDSILAISEVQRNAWVGLSRHMP